MSPSIYLIINYLNRYLEINDFYLKQITAFLFSKTARFLKEIFATNFAGLWVFLHAKYFAYLMWVVWISGNTNILSPSLPVSVLKWVNSILTKNQFKINCSYSDITEISDELIMFNLSLLQQICWFISIKIPHLKNWAGCCDRAVNKSMLDGIKDRQVGVVNDKSNVFLNGYQQITNQRQWAVSQLELYHSHWCLAVCSVSVVLWVCSQYC